MLNQSLGFQATSKCFQVMKEFNAAQAELFLEAHGGSFQNFWDQAQEHHTDGDDNTSTDAVTSTSGIQKDVDSMLAAAQQGLFGIKVIDTTSDVRAKVQSSPDHASKRALDYTMSTVAETSDEEPHSDIEQDDGMVESDHSHLKASAPPPPPAHPPPSDAETESISGAETSDGEKDEDPSAPTPALHEAISSSISQAAATAVKRKPRRESLAGPRLQNTPPHVHCMNGHPLGIKSSVYNWMCDRCKTDYFIGEPVHICDACEYDICDSCCRLACHIQHEHDEPMPYVISSEFIGNLSDDDDQQFETVQDAHVANADDRHSAKEISL